MYGTSLEERAATQAFDWNPQGKRKYWRTTVEDEARTAGLTWAQLKRDARKRVCWRLT